MTADRSCTATFDTDTHTLTVTLAGTGSGTVTSSPAGIDCGSDCSEVYDYDTAVTLTSTPDTGSHFVGWSGDADCDDGSVTMTADRSCTATFDTDTHTLTVTLAGTGSGTVTSSPAGIDCGSDCSEVYDYDTAVTLTPAPDTGSHFVGWSGHADCDDGSVSMTADRSCTATFDTDTHTLTVTLAGTGSGTVTSSPAGIDCGSDCSEVYDYDTAVTLTPAPDTGSHFVGWSGHADCDDGSVSMTADRSCTATFDTDTHTLTVTLAGTGSGTVTSSPTGIDCGSDCSEVYDYDTAVTLTPAPDTGSHFVGWSGDADCDDGSVSMTADRSCTATFSPTGVIPVEIDIKPGSYPNSINLKSKGVIPVAILTTEDFDATTVDADTVRFGPAEAQKVHKQAHVDDVDDDGDLDLVLHFKTQDTNIEVGDDEACLVGYRYDGVEIRGCDSIRLVPPAGSKASGVLASGLALPALVLPLALGVAWTSSHRRRGKVKPYQR
jgi:hypothetical protein